MRMSKSELITQIAQTSGLTKAAASKAVEGFLEVVTATLRSGGSVGLTGFGTFRSMNRKATLGRNPRTGARIQIKATRLPKFKAGKVLKEQVAG